LNFHKSRKSSIFFIEKTFWFFEEFWKFKTVENWDFELKIFETIVRFLDFLNNKRKPQKLVDWLKISKKTFPPKLRNSKETSKARSATETKLNQLVKHGNYWKNVGAQKSMWNEIINSFSCFWKLPINRRSRILEFSENGRN
jgi:hypothetical protein